MGTMIYPTVPVAQPEAEPWPPLSEDGDEHTIRVDEMFARQLDTEFSAGVRGLLHAPETGVSAQRGEAALEAIAGALPALGELKERTLAQAIGPRQRSILEPLIETRLDWAAGTLGRLAQRATVDVDDASVADRIAGLNQDAAISWQDPAYLRKLGRTAVDELRYQGDRRGWDPAEIDSRARSGLSGLYASAVETAINQSDLEGASALYDHAREVIDAKRQAAIDRRFVRAREVALYRDVDRHMEGIPIEPAGPPGAEIFAERAAELTPEDASDEVRARIGQVTAFAQRHAERQWNKLQAGVPSRNAVERIHQELLEARARAAGGPLPAPGGPLTSSSDGPMLPGGGRLERPLGIPGDWQVMMSQKQGGVIYVNPNNSNDQVRVMPGDPSSPYPHRQRPYVIDQNWGAFVTRDGRRIDGPRPGHEPDAHIPYDISVVSQR